MIAESVPVGARARSERRGFGLSFRARSASEESRHGICVTGAEIPFGCAQGRLLLDP